MNTCAEPNHKQNENSQSGQVTKEYTIQEIKSWNRNRLVDWIQQNLTEPLDDEDKELFLKAKITGNIFLNYAGNIDFYEQRCKLPPGTSAGLADLASEIVSKKSKYCCLHHTLHATAS